MKSRWAKSMAIRVTALGLSLASPCWALTLLHSDPEDAHITLDGPISVAGRAPLPIEELPAGVYELTADERNEAIKRGRRMMS